MRRALTRLLRNIRRILKGRIDRADATRRVEALLARLQEPTPHVRRISRVVVYGSYARGALRVSDVDLAIDYEGSSDMLDRAAIDASVGRLAAALEAVEAVAPTLADDKRPRAKILADDAARLRRQLVNGLPVVARMYDPLRQLPAAGSAAAVISERELARLETELKDAVAAFDAAAEARIKFPEGTPSMAAVENLKRMIDELTAHDNRLSIYYHGADMPHARANDDPTNKYRAWRLLWERGDTLDVALARLRSITPEPTARPRGRQTGPGFKT